MIFKLLLQNSIDQLKLLQKHFQYEFLPASNYQLIISFVFYWKTPYLKIWSGIFAKWKNGKKKKEKKKKKRKKERKVSGKWDVRPVVFHFPKVDRARCVRSSFQPHHVTRLCIDRKHGGFCGSEIWCCSECGAINAKERYQSVFSHKHL